MTVITVLYCAHGDNFSPTLAEEKAGVSFSSKIEPGDIGKIGRYRGQPTPDGYGQKDWPEDEVDLVAPNTDFFTAITKLNLASISAGADHRVIRLLAKYGSQCNFEFSSVFLKSLTSLDLTVTVSCYSDPEEEAKDRGDWKDLEQSS